MSDQPKTCTWTLDDFGGDSVWDTQCGHKFEFEFNNEGSPENQIAYCGFCGGHLVEVRTSAREEYEEGRHA